MKKRVLLLTICFIFLVSIPVMAAEVKTYPWDDELCSVFLMTSQEDSEGNKAITEHLWYRFDDGVRKRSVFIEENNHVYFLSEDEISVIFSECEGGTDKKSLLFYSTRLFKLSEFDHIYDSEGKELKTPYPVFYSQSYFPEPMNIEENLSDITYATEVEFLADLQKFDTLKEYFDAKDKEISDSDNYDKLPLLSFKISRKSFRDGFVDIK